MLEQLKEKYENKEISKELTIELIEDSTSNIIDEDREIALIKYIYVTEGDLVFDIEELSPCVFSANGNEYMILTDEEADDECFKYIEESLWAFCPRFLSYNTDLPEEVFRILQEKYEASNNAILRIVEKCGNIDGIVEDAISADGRGHFLSGYDGEENEVCVNGDYFYVYRVY